jgi:hypothetical protein
MGRERGKYQKKHGLYEKANDIFAIFGILFVGFALAKMIVDNAIILNNIRQNTLESYTGSYSCELKRTYGRHRHHYYLISLENGDTLSIPRSSCENQQLLEEQQPLTFRYTVDVRSKWFSDVHAALSITTPDEKISLVDLNESQHSREHSVWIISIILFVWIGLFGGLLFAFNYVMHRDRWLRKRKKILKDKFTSL